MREMETCNSFKRLLKSLLQRSTSNFSILVFFVPIVIDLHNEIVDFRDDRHNPELSLVNYIEGFRDFKDLTSSQGAH